MGEDIIRLQLVLNPQSATNVENQVRNIINRLNNQRITLTFNTNTVNNCIAQLERLEQTARRIQNSNININAHLTETQQTYRLETERIRALSEQQRVAQQITVERERTLQSENNAISALSRENRTLTVNRNVTEEINENVQHTHEHIRRAGNATNDFVTGLGRGLQYIIQYRLLNETINKITEAYRELKAVDDAMVGYRKVTGASKEEIKTVTDDAFKSASKYGRLASEYAESTERFAKAGYGNNSSALSELALLSENTGDIENELANEFIVSSDAAWQLNGNIQELTKILDMFNELSNRTATDVEKLASGVTVSGSMFAQAGLSAQDYAAIIGTATAKTQRSGEEMSRAWRTIIMSLSQIRGTDLETGEVIDADKLAKAEKTLNSIGIQIREVVNGQNELRNPMRVLEDIADKWESLSSIQQSALAESISNKRQSNAFISVIENWNDVKKAIEITANSSGSALRENEIYLDSWSAKSKQVSAEWAEYIANMSDIEMIKGSLDLLASAIDALDTPIGRLISQMVLANTALALTGRLWNGIRARSIIADTLAVGVAEGSLGTAIGLVTEQLWAQATAWIASPLGMATVAALGIYGIVKAVDYFTISLEESREALADLKSEYSNIKSELRGLNDELQITRQRLAELESKDKLTFTEGEELENLRKQNNELERQKDLLEMQEKIKAKEVNDKFVETMEADAGKIEYASGNTKRKETRGGYTYEVNVTDIAEKEYAFNQIEELSKLYAEREKATTEEQIKAIDERIETVNKYIQDKNKEWSEDAEGIEYIQNPTNDDEKKVNKWLDYIHDFQDKMAIAMGGTDAKANAFNRIVDNWQFDDVVQGLQDLGKQGRVTAEMLKAPAYSDFVQKLIDVGFISGKTDDDLLQVANAFNGVGQSAQDARKELTKYAEAKNGVIAKKLNTEDDIRQLINLANAAGASADALNRLEIMKKNLAPGSSRDARVRGLYTKRQIENGTFNWGFTPLKAEDYIDNSGGSSSGDGSSKSSSSTDKDKPDKADPTDAIINRIASNVEALERQGEIIDNQLDMVDAEKEYDKYVELTNKALDNRLKTIEASKTAQNELSKEAQKIRDKYKGIDVDSFFHANGEFTEAYNQYYNSFTSKTKQEAFEDDMKMMQEFKKAWFEYYDDIMGLEKEVFDLRKDLQEAHYDHLSNLIDQLERHAELQEKQSEQEKEYYDYLIEKTRALLDIKKAQFSLENKLISAQREAEKALATSKIGSEYLDEETRKLVYNDDDYALEMDKIKEISDYVEGLTDDYISDINKLGDNEIYKAEEITAQYERRLAIKEKELEVVQAEVDLQKKQNAFNNILAEKNIRQIVDGKWVWTHDTDQLRQATEDLADAKAQVEQLEREKTQLEYTNSLESRIGRWQLEQEAIDLAMEDLNDKIKDFSTKVELLKDPLDNFADIVNELTAELGNINIGNYSNGTFGSSISNSSSSGFKGGVKGSSVQDDLRRNSEGWWALKPAADAGDAWAKDMQNKYHEKNEQIRKENNLDSNNKPLYDSGGVLKGLGGIKATEKDEVVLSPSLTEKILTPENNLLFDRFANNLETIFDMNTLRPLADMFNIPKPNVDFSKNIADRAVTNNYNMNGNVNITESNDIEDTLRRLLHTVQAKSLNN